jgi:sulfatase modifying factor 1
VSAAHYQAFLQSTSKPAAPSYCAWNASYQPSAGWPPPSIAWPVVAIDWCDAWSFCAWAGKRLCGKIGGGPSGNQDEKANTDEWFYACSGGGGKQYPYGTTYVGNVCNGPDAGKGQPAAVGSMAACEGGFAGVFDMSGNVVEWVDACDGYTGASDKCHDRNGSYQTAVATQQCGATYSDARNTTWPDVGIRCCFGPI